MKAAYPKYKSTSIPWLPKVPEGWVLKPITAITKSKSRKGRPDLQLLSVYRDYGVILKSSRDDNHNKAGEDLSSYKVVLPGNLVLNKMKTWQGSLGISDYEGLVSPAYIVCEVDKSINGKYLNYLLRSNQYIYAYNRLSYGIRIDQWDMRYEDFKRLPVYLPPKEEQTAIANYLDTQTEQINRFISKKQKLIELLKEQKQTVVNKYLENDFPLIKLKYLIKGKLKYGANESGEEYNEAYPRYIRITDFGANGNLKENEKLSLKPEVAQNYLLKDGDILFARSGGTVGKTFQFKYSDNSFVACYAGYLIKAEPDSKKILSDFLFYYTQSGLYERWKDAIFNKATIENIGADKYSQLLIPVPCLEEQKKILIKINKETGNIDAVISRTEKEIEIIKEYKQSLIAEVVTGKIKVA